MAEVAASSLGSYLKQAYNSSTDERAQMAVEHSRSEGPRDAPVAKKSAAPSVQVEISAAARKMEAKAAHDAAQEDTQFDLQTYAKKLKDQQLEQPVDTLIED